VILDADGVEASFGNSYLHLVLMPTEACNFRCTYCYEDFALGRMHPEVVTGVKRWLEQRAPELRSLTLSWFGGEPLLAADVITDVLEHVATLRRQHPGMRFQSDITTNGWRLGPEVFAPLHDLGVRSYQVSLDGPRVWHDRTRQRAGGGPTFDRIWANLLGLRDSDREFEVLVRLHASRDNARALPEFVATYAEAFRNDRRFTLFLKRLAPLGGPQDTGFPYLDAAEDAQVLDTVARCAESHAVRFVRAEHLQPICYAARGNSFVVRADGRLGKCTVALDHAANQVGRLHPNGRVELETPAMRRWMRGLWTGDADELECPMRGLAAPAVRLAVAPAADLAGRVDP
jgi:uncharacterized protein